MHLTLHPEISTTRVSSHIRRFDVLFYDGDIIKLTLHSDAHNTYGSLIRRAVSIQTELIRQHPSDYPRGYDHALVKLAGISPSLDHPDRLLITVECDGELYRLRQNRARRAA